MSFKTTRNRTIILGHGIPLPVPITLDATIHEGAIVYGQDGRAYVSNGTLWVDIGTGPRGYTGSRGFTGSAGFVGSRGFTGSQGVQGLIGFTGSQGIQGFTGSQGPQGEQGIQGAIGFTGSLGPIGYTGSRGFTGSVGFTGSQGTQGTQGIQGFTGSRGFTGSSGFVGSQGIIGFTGSKGDPGEFGAVGFTGSRGDTGFTGSIGFTGSKGDGADIVITNDGLTDETRYLTLVNTTSGVAANIYVSSDKLFFNPSTGTLNASEFNSLSDIAHKDDISSIENADDLLERINVYQFKWKETGAKSYGVLAQELESILPELINNSNGTKYVNYTPLIAILLEGYKKLSDKIRELEAK